MADLPSSGDASQEFDLALRELARLVKDAVAAGSHAHFGPMWARRSDRPTEPVHTLYTPVLCVVAQGSKQILLGDERIVYDAGHFLLNSVTLPAAGQVLSASPEAPCLWLAIELNSIRFW